MKKLIQIICIALVFNGFLSCKKDKIITSSSAKLSFSQDSVLFDTVFTKIGSTTKLLRVHNNNNGVVNISSIRLARGTTSFFRLNVDGVPGKSFSNIQIAAKDSIYIFVEVTIDPNASPSNSPFIYRDSILFDLNGNEQHLDLIAFGQNAYYHMPNKSLIVTSTQALYYEVEPCDTVWPVDKPHLIYGYAVVDSACTLTIPAGAKVYLHNGAGIWVYRYGTIKIEGTDANPVTFQGDRLEQEYKDVPGQWDRIWINEGSINNHITYAVIKNAYIGVHAGFTIFDGLELPWITSATPPPSNLLLENTIIQNASYAGVLGHDYIITGGNNVVVNCGQHLCEFDYGGSYTFYQSTFANYWNQTNNANTSSARTTPSFYFNNYYNGVNGNTLSSFAKVYFGNCILDGTLAEEFQFDTLAQSGGFSPPYLFDHCALKTGLIGANGTHSSSCITITATANLMRFIGPSTYNFDISVTPPYSAAYQAGSTSANGGYFNDINGNSFTSSGGNPDMGAYAK